MFYELWLIFELKMTYGSDAAPTTRVLTELSKLFDANTLTFEPGFDYESTEISAPGLDSDSTEISAPGFDYLSTEDKDYYSFSY